MAWYYDQIKILNNYQGTQDPDNNSKLPLGTDYSNTHIRNKGNLLFIGDIMSGTSIALKAFLSSFSINLNVDYVDEDLVEGKKHSVKNIGLAYSLEVLIPALSINDAMVNATRLEMLEIMISTSTLTSSVKKSKKKTAEEIKQELLNKDKKQKQGSSSPTVIPIEERKVVLLSNLINNGNYTNKKSITNFSLLEKYGLQCFIEEISYSATVDMGFFEYNSKLWPKEYSLKLDLLVPTKMGDKSIIKVFDSDGAINSSEFTSNGSWPFGVATK